MGTELLNASVLLHKEDTDQEWRTGEIAEAEQGVCEIMTINYRKEKPEKKIDCLVEIEIDDENREMATGKKKED